MSKSDQTPDLRAMLEAFHDTFEEEVSSREQWHQEFRQNLIEEEVDELLDHVEEGGFDAEGYTEELADIVYTAFGTAVCFDVDLYAQLEETHAENMEKDHLKTPEDYE